MNRSEERQFLEKKKKNQKQFGIYIIKNDGFISNFNWEKTMVFDKFTFTLFDEDVCLNYYLALIKLINVTFD